MMRVDLHCHSKFSAHPSEWFLQRIGTRESYTEVESLYKQAKARGMTHVTITDHNTIEGARELAALHPEDTFISVEATAYFPEDGCKVHILIYDITPEQFDVVQEARDDIYQLRDYLRQECLACSVAHATYSVNGRLSQETIEKLLLLFDVFEGMNGARGKLHNNTLQNVLGSCTSAHLNRLHKKHGIEPWGMESWKKGVTAGSDDHAGLFVGRTYTESASAMTLKAFTEAIRAKQTVTAGSQGDHKALAFAIYKIARDFSRDRTQTGDRGFMGFISSLLFDDQRGGVREWWALKKLKRAKDSRAQALARFCEEIAAYQGGDFDDAHARVDAIYSSLGRLTDEFFVMLMTSIETDLKNGNADRVLKNISAALPAAFMIAPFFTSMHHLYCRNRDVLRAMDDSFGVAQRGPSRLLWFSDTVTDLNGVAVTMRELATTAAQTGRPVKLVTCLPEDEAATGLPPNSINLPCIYSVTPEFYSAYTLRLPSILSALDIIANESPDEIVISTPGPVGLLGLAAARVLGVRCTGIYHTDFTKQADLFIGDEWVSSAVEAYTRWFFQQMDHVRVPSQQYITMMSDRGLDPSRMSIFRRGIEPRFSEENSERQSALRASFGIPRVGAKLMWAGRLGKEKNLDFLMDVCREVMSQRPGTSLLMVGDGPELERLKHETTDDERIVFTGRVNRADLAQLYLMSDVFVFPSTTDTFGMVILEGHACGLPAIVTDVGGPQEIVTNGETGFVLRANDKQAWVAATIGMIDIKQQDPGMFAAMRQKAREGSHGEYGWERVLDEMTGMTTTPATPSLPEGRADKHQHAMAVSA
jgi:glycosyltransferase involved in cell wall biosynthesis